MLVGLLSGALITLREGMEAFLVVGILLCYLRKVGAPQFKMYVWLGTLVALAGSVVLALLFQLLAVQFEEESAEVFEFLVSLVAIAVLTWMVLWMQRQSRGFRGEMEARVAASMGEGQAVALGTLALVTVIREGLETALFLAALAQSVERQSLLMGAGLGIGAAVLMIALIFQAIIRLNLRWFFIVTGWMLIFIAAGLVGHSLMILNETGLVPPVVDPVWNTESLISNESLWGKLLHVFMGYEARPSLTQVIAYFGYLFAMGWLFQRAVLVSRER
ncbi:MAG: FTR1 family protein [Deltaproteobacteria bacterium]|nr:FTR1 family protein [Deltaproteobacteria bacterium]MBW2307622.1 FTR1 family protein [Deltaproteobacteria bacterium]